MIILFRCVLCTFQVLGVLLFTWIAKSVFLLPMLPETMWCTEQMLNVIFFSFFISSLSGFWFLYTGIWFILLPLCVKLLLCFCTEPSFLNVMQWQWPIFVTDRIHMIFFCMISDFLVRYIWFVPRHNCSQSLQKFVMWQWFRFHRADFFILCYLNYCYGIISN